VGTLRSLAQRMLVKKEGSSSPRYDGQIAPVKSSHGGLDAVLMDHIIGLYNVPRRAD
jgi:hypothetical protein